MLAAIAGFVCGLIQLLVNDRLTIVDHVLHADPVWTLAAFGWTALSLVGLAQVSLGRSRWWATPALLAFVPSFTGETAFGILPVALFKVAGLLAVVTSAARA